MPTHQTIFRSGAELTLVHFPHSSYQPYDVQFWDCSGINKWVESFPNYDLALSYYNRIVAEQPF